MNSGIRATFWIAGGLILTAIFPLPGLMAGCVLAGMGLHALLSNPPLPNDHGHHDIQQDKSRQLTNRRKQP